MEYFIIVVEMKTAMIKTAYNYSVIIRQFTIRIYLWTYSLFPWCPQRSLCSRQTTPPTLRIQSSSIFFLHIHGFGPDIYCNFYFSSIRWIWIHILKGNKEVIYTAHLIIMRRTFEHTEGIILKMSYCYIWALVFLTLYQFEYFITLR